EMRLTTIRRVGYAGRGGRSSAPSLIWSRLGAQPSHVRNQKSKVRSQTWAFAAHRSRLESVHCYCGAFVIGGGLGRRSDFAPLASKAATICTMSRTSSPFLAIVQPW